MKKPPLPLSEAFTIHATALMNKVHHRTPRVRRDDQKHRLLLARKGHLNGKAAGESGEMAWRVF